MKHKTEWIAQRWRQLRPRLPMGIALAGVTAVWALGCVWSFTEQRAFAADKRFEIAELLPLVLDGFAVSMAAVAFAASLDARPAVAARIITALSVAASATSNGVWAAERSQGDPATIALAVGIPITANLAFEVLLGELRRQVQRSRGLPAPVAIPTLRVVRLLLAPIDTFRSWRRQVLDLTAPTTWVVVQETVRETVWEVPDHSQDQEEEHSQQQEDTTRTDPEPAPTEAVTGETTDEFEAIVADLVPDNRTRLQQAEDWYKDQLRDGQDPTATACNIEVGTNSYIKGHHLRAWREEVEQETRTRG